MIEVIVCDVCANKMKLPLFNALVDALHSEEAFRFFGSRYLLGMTLIGQVLKSYTGWFAQRKCA